MKLGLAPKRALERKASAAGKSQVVVCQPGQSGTTPLLAQQYWSLVRVTLTGVAGAAFDAVDTGSVTTATMSFNPDSLPIGLDACQNTRSCAC